MGAKVGVVILALLKTIGGQTFLIDDDKWYTDGVNMDRDVRTPDRGVLAVVLLEWPNPSSHGSETCTESTKACSLSIF